MKKKYEYPLEYIINEMTVTNIKVLIEGDLTCGKLWEIIWLQSIIGCQDWHWFYYVRYMKKLNSIQQGV